MKRVFLRFFIPLLALACLSEPALAANPVRIVVYGDSLTSGYQLGPDDAYSAKLQKKLKDLGYEKVEVINLSVAGESTAQGLERISSVQVKHPDIVLLELGINDALGGINMGIINSNLGYMIGRMQQLNIEVVLLGTVAPPNMGQNYVNQYAAVQNSLATKYGVALVPNIMDGVVGSSLTLGDGFHPNNAGVDVIVENTFRAVDGALRAKWNQMQMQQYEQSQQPAGAAPPEIIAPSGVPPEAR